MLVPSQHPLEPRQHAANPWQGSWGRWPQEQGLMTPHATQMHDPRDATAEHRQKTPLAPPFVMTSPFNNGSVQHAPTPQYQPQYYSFGSFAPPPPPTAALSATYRPEYHERSPYPEAPSVYEQRPYYHPADRRDRMPFEDLAHSPTTSSDSGVSIAYSTAMDPSTKSKVIVKNETINPEDAVVFNTPIDRLMRSVQSHKTKKRSMVQNTRSGPASPMQPFVKLEGRTESGKPIPKKRKQYRCDGPNCGKLFPQKARLVVHRRSHTGERPHVCTYPECDFRTTQPGNLTSHLRTHTGEKPFACEQPGCHKKFARKNGLTSHQKTHSKIKPHICKLDNCNKKFSTNGNLKSHQNNLHVHVIERLMLKLETGDSTPEEAELMEHLSVVHHNANKGIKGRGKSKKLSTNTEMGVQIHGPSSSGSPSSIASTPPHTPNSAHYGQGLSPMVAMNESQQGFHGHEYALYSHGSYEPAADMTYNMPKRSSV